MQVQFEEAWQARKRFQVGSGKVRSTEVQLFQVKQAPVDALHVRPRQVQNFKARPQLRQVAN
jgi:hypothetical protein